MIDARFEWDDAKARSNLRKHGVDFEGAKAVFDDPARVETLDLDEQEERFILTGMAARGLLVVVYTERNNRFRIISARLANKGEQNDYYLFQDPG
jgi:uncharacterized DUF497 family protein